MDDHFRVRVGRQVAALGDQFSPEVLVIFDDPVVDDGDAVGRVRVGVDFVRHAMGRPAGMADADRAGDGHLVQADGQVG
jgi:hypothetical protein